MSQTERVLLVPPTTIYGSRSADFFAGVKQTVEALPPMGIAIVSAMLKQHGGFEVKNLPGGPNDRSLVDGTSWADVVVISTTLIGTESTQGVIALARERGKKVIVGGYGPTFLPEKFEGASVVLGEGEPVFPQVMEDLLGGHLQPQYDSRGNYFDIYNHYICPDREILESFNGGLLSVYPMETQRGCSNNCPPCSAKKFQGGVRVRDIRDDIAEIETMNIRPGGMLFFADNNTMHLPEDQLYGLLTYLSQKDIRWATEGTVETLIRDNEQGGRLLKLMSPIGKKNGGCYSFCYGADDLTRKVVAGTKEKTEEVLPKAIRLFREYQIPLHVSVIVGLDNHVYPDSFYRMAQILEAYDPHHVFVHIATPYPGTVWGDNVAREERLLGFPYSDYTHGKVVFKPKNMESEELQQGYYWLKRRLTCWEALKGLWRNHVDLNLIRQKPILGMALSGIPWFLECAAAMQELSRQGKIDQQVQRDLDNDYRNYCGRKKL
ncbi:MAG: cobalamin-dependent protein [Patescibacteria group bacterium]|nr:cobalamin-dependent protein [Patescibacteria group bacterium]